MTGNEFANLLRVANCLSYDEMISIFGNDFDHYHAKLQAKGLAGFIMYLDGDNAKRFFEVVSSKREAQRLNYGA